MELVRGQRIGSFIVVFPIKATGSIMTCRAKGNDGGIYYLRVIDTSVVSPETRQALHLSKVVRGLSHPGVATLKFTSKETLNGKVCQVDAFDFISGESLQSYLANHEGCLSVYEAKAITRSLLQTLIYLHQLEKPIVLRGLNPKSVVMDCSKTPPVPVVWDFSEAAYLRDEDVQTDFKAPFYVAPECYRKEHTFASDIYSVCAVLYTMLFGYAPYFFDLSEYSIENRDQALLNAKSGSLILDYEDVYEFDDSLAEVIYSALSDSLDKRIKSADTFLDLLDGIIQNTLPNVNSLGENEKHRSGLTTGGFADVAGMSSLKSQLKSDVIDLLRSPRQAKELGLSLPNGILFYGPPGCGKSFFVEKFAQEAGCHYIYVKCSDVASPYIHGGQGKIAELFKEAEKNAPSIIFFDEIDAMVKDRSYHSNVSEAGEVNEFLTQLNNCGERGIIAIGATNKPNDIDKAALRAGRLEYKYYFSPPDHETRAKIFEIELLRRKIELDIDFDVLAEKTEGYISSDIKFIVDKAAREVFRSKAPNISMQILLKVIATTSPSVPEDVLKEYENMALAFLDNPRGKKQRKIGFY